MAEVDHRTDHVPEWKREEVGALVDLVGDYESVGIVDVAGIPSRQLQEMRADLHGTAAIRMSRNTLVRRALESVDEGLEALVEYVDGQVGLVCTDENPFGLYRQLEASKTPAPIGAGEVAPNDIVIPAGDTGMDPGPFVGDLQEVGADARIQEGSIRVLEDSTVLEAGEVVSPTLEKVLNELGIEPKEVGLDLRAVYADGVVFEADELAIDVDAYRDDVRTAGARARTLAMEAGFPTSLTLPLSLRTAAGEAKSLAIHAAIEDPDVIPDLVGRADAQLRSLAAAIDDEEALPAALRAVEAPTAAPTEADEAEEPTDEPETDTDAEADDDDDDEGDGAEGLGAMFG